MLDKNMLMDKFSRVDSRGRTLLTPFVVSKKRKTLYLHIAKTGGSTVTSILRDNKLDDRVLTAKKRKISEKKKHFQDIVDHWDEYFKFTFVRNKFDLLVSLWHYDKRFLNVDFPTFIRKVVVPSLDNYNWWIDQYFLTTLQGEPIFDFVGRTESLTTDLSKVCRRIGIKKHDTRRRRNVGRYDRKIPFWSYYTDELGECVHGKFRQEIDHFKFMLPSNMR